MNKKQKTLSLISAVLFSLTASFSSYAVEPTAPIKQAPVTPAKGYTITSIDSNKIAFSRVKSSKGKNGYNVTGDTKLKTMQHRVIRLPGYILVTLKAANGTEIESIKARHYKKFSGSKAGHFDAVIKTTPPDGSQIIVTHVNN